MHAYLKEISRQPLLSRTEERELARRIEAGDCRARDKVISANLRLVVAIAKHYRGNGLEYLDLIQEGSLGLLQAVDRYDWRGDAKFSTYAAWWIRAAIGHALTTQQALKTQAADPRTSSLDQSLDRTAAERAELLDDHALDETLGDVLTRLPKRRRQVLELRYGLRGEQARTVTQAATELNLSRERVRQIEIKTLRGIARDQALQAVRQLQVAA